MAPALLNAPHGLQAMPRAWAHYAQSPCRNTTSALHGHGFNVCGNCTEMTEQQHWYKLAKARMEKAPPDRAQETNRWRDFWTRLCQLCEEREQLLVHQRNGTGANLFAIAPPGNQNQMVNYPVNTCICLNDGLAREKYCKPHRKVHWDSIRTGNNGMVQVRNRNKEWLRTVAVDNNGVLCRASAARLVSRAGADPNRYNRGCRCGREINPNNNAQVYLCMVCEGIWEVQAMAWPPVKPPTNAHLTHGMTVDAHGNRELRLSRPRAAHTW